jgi:hypothetical protein
MGVQTGGRSVNGDSVPAEASDRSRQGRRPGLCKITLVHIIHIGMIISDSGRVLVGSSTKEGCRDFERIDPVLSSGSDREHGASKADRWGAEPAATNLRGT